MESLEHSDLFLAAGMLIGYYILPEILGWASKRSKVRANAHMFAKDGKRGKALASKSITDAT